MSIRLGLFYPNARSVHVGSAAVAAANLDVLDFETHRKVAQVARNDAQQCKLHLATAALQVRESPGHNRQHPRPT